MATEKFITGKKDDCNHVGRYHNVRAEMEAQSRLDDYLNGFDIIDAVKERPEPIPEPECPPHLQPNQFRRARNFAIFSGLYNGSYYENGIKNPGGEVVEDTPSETVKMIAGREYHIPKPPKKKKR